MHWADSMHQTNGAKLTFVTLECYRDRNRHSPRAHSRSPHWPQPRRYIRNTQNFQDHSWEGRRRRRSRTV